MGWKDMITVEDEETVETTTTVTHTSEESGAIVLFEPKSFEEATAIADKIKRGNATAINLHRLSKDYAQRTIDFLTGVVYALDGRIEKIGHNLILCSPNNLKVSGSINLNRDVD